MQLKSMLLITAIAAAIVVAAQTSRVGGNLAVKQEVSPTCPTGKIDIVAASAEEIGDICRGARAAFETLEKCGFRLPHPIKVEAGTTLMTAGMPKRWGDFTPSKRLVRLSSQARREEAMPQVFFGTSLSAPEHYAGIAAHEIAHAVFAHAVSANTISFDLPATAHEYVAYVIQMMSFSEATRRRILARDPPATVSNLFIFSFFLLYSDPERFAVHAYAHFALPENGCSFISRVLRGEVHFPPASD